MDKLGKKRLKILVVKSYHKGDTVVWEKASGLKKLGHYVEVLIPKKSQVKTFLENQDIPVHIINIRSSMVTSNFWRKRYLDIVSIFKLRKLFHQFDIVDLNLQRARILGRISNIFRKKPIIISTVHGQDLDVSWIWLMEIFTKKIDNKTVAISKDIKSYLLEKGFPAPKVSVIYNGVNLKAIDSVPYTQDFLYRLIGLKSEIPLVGMIARFYPHIKGHEVFIRSACQVKAKYPHIHFVIIGGAPFEDDNFFIEMRNLTKKLNLEKTVHFIGELPNTDIPKVLDSLKVLVVPSLIREGFGLVIAEAMARKIPVIGSKIGAIPEVIKDIETGLLVPPKNPEALAKAMIFILSNPQKAKEMGEAGRRRVEKNFTIGIMAHKYEKLFYRLIDNECLK